MDIGISTACFYPELLTEESIKVIAGMGFKKIEVFLETTSEYQADYCRRLMGMIEREGLEVYSVHAFSVQYESYLFDKYPPRKADAWQLFKKVVRAADILRAKCITFHGPGRKWLDANAQFDVEDIAQEMDKLARQAEQYGLFLAWENVYWCLSHDIEAIKKIMVHITSNNIGFTLDLKQANRSGIQVEEYLDIMSEKLMNIHINDNSPGNMCLLPGQGEFDYKKLFDELDEVGYKGPVIIEVYRDNFVDYDEIVKARDFLLAFTK